MGSRPVAQAEETGDGTSDALDGPLEVGREAGERDSQASLGLLTQPSSGDGLCSIQGSRVTCWERGGQRGVPVDLGAQQRVSEVME